MLKRLLGPAAITVCTIALTASTASAATFRAEQGGTGSTCTPAAPCGTIDAALSAARSSAGPDTLQIGPGVWNEQIVLDGRDSGLEVVGAGSGADAASSTILRGTGDLVRLIAGPDGAPGMTVRKLRLEGLGSYTDRLLSVGASGSHFDDVTVTGDLRPGTMAIGAGVDTTFDHLNVSVFSGGALRVDGGQVAVRDSSLSSLPADTVDTPTTSAAESSTLSFVRSRVVAATGSFSAIATSGALRVDSSTVTGGCRAAIDHDPALPRAATVSNSTVDVGEAGFTDTDEVSSYCGTPSSLVERGAGTTNVRSSIVLEPVRGDAGAISCRWSSVPLLSRPASAQGGAVDCGAAGHNGAPAAPGTLFRDATHLDYRLVANAPVIDAGDPAPLAAGESATDRDGKPADLAARLGLWQSRPPRPGRLRVAGPVPAAPAGHQDRRPQRPRAALAEARAARGEPAAAASAHVLGERGGDNAHRRAPWEDRRARQRSCGRGPREPRPAPCAAPEGAGARPLHPRGGGHRRGRQPLACRTAGAGVALSGPPVP